jgi:16S rRNA (adenine1518-N6/adenine1519-N6)-dimethyltransferase
VSELLQKTKARLAELGIEPKRSLGQNFLISDQAVAKILGAVADLDPRHLIEIGPGVGSLTDGLRAMDKPFLIIELDRELARYWRAQGAPVIESDALKVDWEKLPVEEPAVLVSNLPYQISTHLAVDRCFGPRRLTAMVLMFQKEVAQRLMAVPKTKAYGLLSVMVQAHWDIRKLIEIGPSQFWPAPKVASQVLVFKRKLAPFPGREKAFLTLLKAAFAQRRKFLMKNLLALKGAYGIDQERLAAVFGEIGLSGKARAEELGVEQFKELFKVLDGN